MSSGLFYSDLLMGEEMKCIWITWEKQRRNKGISSSLGWHLYEITFNDLRIKRYVRSIKETISIINKEKPEIIVVQNPSIILALLAISLKYFFKYKIVVDAHNSGLFPITSWLQIIANKIQAWADLTIVTNDQLKKVVESHKGKAIVLPDCLPVISATGGYSFEGRANIVFICTFSVDEPYQEVLQAAVMIPQDVMIYITGKYHGKVDPSTVPLNIRLLGFVPDEEYLSLLSSADVIMDLTLWEGCLVCGAYEAVSLSRPLILSDTRALREYFSKGCVYVKPTASSISAGIMKALDDRQRLIEEMKVLKACLHDRWNDRFAVFMQSLESL